MQKLKTMLVLISGFFVAVSCSTTADYVLMNKTAQELMSQADDLMSSNKKEESVKLIMTIRDLHPNDPKINQLLDKLTPEERAALDEDSLLGFNKAKRAELVPTDNEKWLWYLPDRIMDLIDSVSLSLDIGGQIGAGAWATRGLQAVAYVGSTASVGFYQKRNVGAKLESSLDLAIGPVGGTAIYGMRMGSGGIDDVSTALWFHKPTEKLYQQYRDFWGLGLKFGFAYVGAELEFHPVEVYDFIWGIFTVDPLGDDFVHTRRLVFADSQKENMKKMQKFISEAGEKGIIEYRKKYPNL